MDVRLVVWERGGRRRLELEREGGLPRVSVDGGAAVEPPSVLVQAVRRTWGFDVALVRVAAENLAEVEYLGDEDTPVPGLRWRPWTMTPRGAQRPPWQRPGWLGDVLTGVDARLTGSGLRRTGRPVQERHTSITALLRIPTNCHPVWLKAALPIFKHESRVVRWLGGIAPATVPEVIAEGPGWWLSAPFPAAGGPPAGHFAAALADLQISSIPHVAELRALGCPDRLPSDLTRNVAQLVDRTDLTTQREREALRSVLPELASVCTKVDELGFPPTLVHGDLNPENVLGTRDGWFLFDWTDACIAHPLADLALCVRDDDEQGRAAGIAAYAGRWAGLARSADIERALRVAPAIGAAHQVVTYRWILDEVDRSAADISGGDQLHGLLRAWIRSLVEALSS